MILYKPGSYFRYMADELPNKDTYTQKTINPFSRHSQQLTSALSFGSQNCKQCELGSDDSSDHDQHFFSFIARLWSYRTLSKLKDVAASMKQVIREFYFFSRTRVIP